MEWSYEITLYSFYIKHKHEMRDMREGCVFLYRFRYHIKPITSDPSHHIHDTPNHTAGDATCKLYCPGMGFTRGAGAESLR